MVDPVDIKDAFAELNALLALGDKSSAAAYLSQLHPADSAEVLTLLTTEARMELTARLDTHDLADVFEQMDEEDIVEVAEHLDVERLADILDAMEADEAADLLGELDDQEVTELLVEMEAAEDVQPLLKYDDDTAGGIMNVVPPCLRRAMTIREAYAFIKEHYGAENELYYLYVLDRNGGLIGVVNLRALILAEPEQTVEEVMNAEVISTGVDTDQEEVAKLLARYDLLALPIVDEGNHLVGIVSVDDVVDVLEEEATEDIYRLAQVSEEAEIFSRIPRAVRNRLPWLYINLGTALLSASIVAFYEDTIAAAAVLAAFMPIVAAQGGNAGNQTMTIVVRSLALGEMDLHDGWRALRHEWTVSTLHGIILGASIGLLAFFWKGNPVLSAIIAISMLANLFISAFVGVTVPLTLKRVGVDPALASGVFVTATTDFMGFAIFLGLATTFILWLV